MQSSENNPQPFYARNVGGKIFSIHGIIPHSSEHEYKFVDEFLWQLTAIDQKIPEGPFVFVIDSNGGSTDTFWAMYDTMQLLTSPVYTIARSVASGGALLAIAGTIGNRYILPHAKMILHGVQTDCHGIGNASDELKNIQNYNREIAAFLDTQTSGKILNLVATDGDLKKRQARVSQIETAFLDKDRSFTATEAITYGLMDKILTGSIYRKLVTL